MKNCAKTSCVGNSEVIYSGYKMYQELKILRDLCSGVFVRKAKVIPMVE